MAEAFVLEVEDLRAAAAYAAACAGAVLAIFEQARPGDPRPREAIDAALVFAAGGKRVKALRDTAWAAMRAAQDADGGAPEQAARSAMSAASAAWLHPLPRSTQVSHMLGAAAHAARAAELAAGDPDAGADHIERAALRASPALVQLLRRYPAAPPGGGRVGELLRLLDGRLREIRPDETG
ncbi:MAG: putative immunity protein [Sphingobium sp.]